MSVSTHICVWNIYTNVYIFIILTSPNSSLYVCMYMYACVCVSMYYRDKREPLENIQSLIEIGFEEHLRQKEKENCEQGAGQMLHRALINHSESGSQDELSRLQAYNLGT